MFSIITQKKCTKCGEIKQLNQFYKRKDTKDGRGSECKACHAVRNRKQRHDNPERARGYGRKWKAANHKQVIESNHRYYKENRSKILAFCRKWQAANIDKVLETGRRWYKNHREQEKQNSRQYRAENPEKIRAYGKEWRKKNHEKVLELNRNRRAVKKQVGGKITSIEWNALKKKYNYTCLCCGRREPEIKLTLDHVVPIALGGMHVIENAQPLCLSCNSSKNVKIMDYRK